MVTPPESALAPASVYVAVVDDNTFYRDWLGQAGTLPASCHVVARTADAEQLAALMASLPDRRCDVVLLDLRVASDRLDDPLLRSQDGGSDRGTRDPLQGRSAVELVLQAAENAVRAGQLAAVPVVLVYTQEQSPRVHVACLLAGACGVVHKGETLDRLGEAILAAADGALIVDERTAGLIELLANQQGLDLTISEAAVLALAAHGHPRREIAKRLDSSESTIDKHLRAIRDKFGHTTNLTDLADTFGLRDLAVPRPNSATEHRHRIRALSRRLSGRA